MVRDPPLGLASGKWNEQGADVKEEVTMYNSIRERKTKAKEGNAGQDRAMKNSREGFVIARGNSREGPRMAASLFSNRRETAAAKFDINNIAKLIRGQGKGQNRSEQSRVDMFRHWVDLTS